MKTSASRLTITKLRHKKDIALFTIYQQTMLYTISHSGLEKIKSWSHLNASVFITLNSPLYLALNGRNVISIENYRTRISTVDTVDHHSRYLLLLFLKEDFPAGPTFHFPHSHPHPCYLRYRLTNKFSILLTVFLLFWSSVATEES